MGPGIRRIFSAFLQLPQRYVTHTYFAISVAPFSSGVTVLP
ncbi:hypothetical protein SAMN02982989_1501 [Xaviernesmea oryzae]|uniref:Uncharacterized protein n=1 Tax=Xaviernesmea oryzae TaxID=464029 RepID=A0A1X7EM97_9HYPH|nr:hypothetical protein SAMN02982989_1501 [Xaviernesmea oryzae]